MKEDDKQILRHAHGQIIRVLDFEVQDFQDKVSSILQHQNIADVIPGDCIALTKQAADIRALEMIGMLLADVAGVPRYQPDPAPDPEISDYAI